MNDVLVLRHQDDAGPGNLADWLSGNGIPFEVLDVPAAAAAAAEPAVRRRAVVVLGSREAAYDDTAPWLGWELAFLRDVLDAGTPLLGICFGAQLLARLSGGSVAAATTPERGWVEVTSEEPLLAGTWLGWHGDEITAPPGVEVLARSGACLQAFRTGPHLGVQFHPEVTPAGIEDWMTQDRRLRQLDAVDSDARALLAETAVRTGPATTAAHHLYSEFFHQH